MTCSAADAGPLRGAGRARSRRSTASRSTRSATAPSCSTSAARSRSSRRCRCAPATTCRWPTRPASAASRWRSTRTPRTCGELTIKGNSVAVVTDGSAVLGLGNIGPGAAMPVMEGKAALFKRFADIDAWPICLATQDTDEIVTRRRDDRAGLRRHQPRGHRRAALLRDRAPAARVPRHPGLPRRPARHRDRRPRRADQRAALRQEDAAPTCASWSPAPARRAPRSSRCCSPREPATSWSSTARAPCPPTTHPVARARRARRRDQPAPRDRLAPGGAGRRRRLRRRQRPRHPQARVDPATWPTDAGGVRAGQPRPGGRPGRGRQVRRGRGERAGPTTPTRSTTCSPSPASSAACSTPAPRTSRSTCCSAPPRRSPTWSATRSSTPAFIIPSVFHPDVDQARGRRDQRQARAEP